MTIEKRAASQRNVGLFATGAMFILYGGLTLFMVLTTPLFNLGSGGAFNVDLPGVGIGFLQLFTGFGVLNKSRWAAIIVVVCGMLGAASILTGRTGRSILYAAPSLIAFVAVLINWKNFGSRTTS